MCLFICVGCVPTHKVTEVIDGDTFKTETGETVRLLGINAPEINDPGGDIAQDFLRALVLNKHVRLEPDVTDKDDYDRLLRYVYVSGQFVNGELIRMGYAETRSYPPDTLYKRELKALEKNALRNKRGLWSFPVFQIPDTAQMHTKVYERTASDAISWRAADKYYGQVKTVEGVIVASNNTGKVCFLNFHQNWRKYFTAVIFASDFDKFPAHPEDHYLNRRVRIRGLIKEYKGKPEIILKSTSQIEVLE
jgi:micrococcal nuclease